MANTETNHGAVLNSDVNALLNKMRDEVIAALAIEIDDHINNLGRFIRNGVGNEGGPDDPIVVSREYWDATCKKLHEQAWLVNSLRASTGVGLPTDQATDSEQDVSTIPILNPHRAIAWGNTVTRPFLDSVIWIQDQLGLNASYLMACMKFESNLDPKARNPKSSASGLIQFMDATARRLGTTIEKIRIMDGVQQLNYVYKYFKSYADAGHKLAEWGPADVYMAILWPAGIGKSMIYKVFINDPKKLSDAYDVNKGLDRDNDGVVTKAEASARVIALLNEGLTAKNAFILKD